MSPQRVLPTAPETLTALHRAAWGRASGAMHVLAIRYPDLDLGQAGEPDVAPGAPSPRTHLQGLMGTAPFLALLASLRLDGTGDRAIWIERATAVLVSAVMHAEQPLYDNAAPLYYPATLALRVLSGTHAPDMSSVLHVLQAPLTPAAWYAALTEWLEQADPESELGKRVSTLARVLGYLLGDIERRASATPRPREPGPAAGGIEGPITPCPVIAQDADADAADPGSASAWREQRKEREEASRPGTSARISPEPRESTKHRAREVRPEPELMRLDDARPPIPSIGVPRFVATPRQAEAIRARLQSLPGIELSRVQAARMHMALARLPDRHLAIAVAAALFGERDAWADVGVAYASGDLPTASGRFWIVLEPFAVAIPNRVSALLPAPPAGATPDPADYVVVGIPGGMPGARALRDVARAHFDRRVDGRDTRNDLPLFTADDAKCTDRALRGSTTPRRITLAWLANLQRVFCQVRKGGTTDLDLCVHAVHDFHARTSAHYRRIAALRAATLRGDLIADIATWLDPDGEVESTEPIPQAGELGGRRYPDPDRYRAWVARMKEAIETPPTGRLTPARIAPFHNAFVVYSALLLLFAVGARPHQPAIDQFNHLDALLILQDKGPDGRLALLPNIAREQRAHLNAHIRCIARQLPHISIDAPFVLLDGDGSARPLTIRAINDLSGNPFPANANRHSFINELRDAYAMREDRVALFAGHTRPGREAGGPYSAMPPAPRCDELAAAQSRLLDFGWQAIKGFMGKPR